LPPAKIRAMLKKANVKGNIEPIIELFSWRNGTFPMQDFTGEKTRIIPHSRISLMRLENMIDHYLCFKEMEEYNPRYKTLGGRFFPLFWDGSSTYILVDLESPDGEILLLETQSDHFLREGYCTFADFIRDAIRANQMGEPLHLSKAPTNAEQLPFVGIRSGDILIQKVEPSSESTLVLRTDFSDDASWQSLCEVLKEGGDDVPVALDFVSDQKFDGLVPTKLGNLLKAQSKKNFAFVIDIITLEKNDHPILVVWLGAKRVQTFRVIPSELGNVDNNLSIANMGFEEFANAVDQDGVFRGFSGS